MIVRAAPDTHLPWLAKRAQLVVSPTLRAIEATDEASGRILGMVGYDSWLPNACSMHVALEEPIAARRLLGPAFGIPFIEMDLGLVLAWILSTNPRSLAFTRHLGFRETYRVADGWQPGIDLVLFEMRREQCRWIPRHERVAA